MNLIILRSALEDIERGFQFYESQAEGLGAYFEETIRGEIESLRLYGGVHRKLFERHRLVVRRFPYAIYYDVDGETVRIRAVVDCRRKPERIQKKLK